jgi:hypothetical protein
MPKYENETKYNNPRLDPEVTRIVQEHHEELEIKWAKEHAGVKDPVIFDPNASSSASDGEVAGYEKKRRSMIENPRFKKIVLGLVIATIATSIYGYGLLLKKHDQAIEKYMNSKPYAEQDASYKQYVAAGETPEQALHSMEADRVNAATSERQEQWKETGYLKEGATIRSLPGTASENGGIEDAIGTGQIEENLKIVDPDDVNNIGEPTPNDPNGPWSEVTGKTRAEVLKAVHAPDYDGDVYINNSNIVYPQENSDSDRNQ